jgi:hypothetical protein
MQPTAHRTPGTPDRSADWDRAAPFSGYLGTVEETPELWQVTYRRARVEADALARAEALPGSWKLLALSEDWCGDAANTLPVLAKLADEAASLDLRVLGRDDNPDLMDAHLTGGASRSIPVVMVLDADGREHGWWGPRPAELQTWRLTDEVKQMDSDERYKRVRIWYARDRGRTTLDEVLSLLESVAAVPAG